MICLLILVIVGWILVTISGALRENGSVYWVWLILGTIVLCGILAGVAFYLAQLVNSIRVNRRQANFIDAVTHELKSPIASLRLGLETMSRRKLSTEDMNKFTRAMKKDVHRLDRLVSHLLDAAGLTAVAKTVASRGGHLLVDEIYQGLCYDLAPLSAAAVAPEAFVVNSFSKYFGMTGWRLGWLVAPEAAVEPLTRLAQNVFLSAPTPAQHAALAAFEPECREILEARRRETLRR